MGRPGQVEQGRSGCLDILSSCFKQSPKPRTPSLDAPKARPARAQNPEARPDQSDVSPPTVSVSGKASSAVLNSPDTSTLPGGTELSPRTHDQPSPKEQQVPDLWAEAFQGLDEGHKSSISDNVPSMDGSPVEQLIGLVRVREDDFKDHSAKIKIGDREVLWRDSATRVIRLLSSAVDIGIQFAPAPGSVVWSALKVLLNAHASGCEGLTVIFGCADRVLCVMNRGATYEEVFLKSGLDNLDACAKDLRKALIDTYQKALELLDYATTQLRDDMAVRRFFEALWDPQKAKDKLSQLQEAEQSLMNAVAACHVKSAHFQGKKGLRLLERLEKPLRYTDEKITKMLTQMEDYKVLDILDSICKIHIGNQHSEMTAKKTQGTGEWILQHEDFRGWENSSSSNILWLTGKIGAGKSVLISTIVDRYQVKQNSQVQVGIVDSKVDDGFAFFYYSKNNQAITADPVANILRSFLRQLAQVPHYSNRIFHDLASLCEKMRTSQQAFTPDICRDMISTLVNMLPRTTLVLDSLDELKPQHMQDIVRFFVDLVNTSERPVKMFITSRFTTDISHEVYKANNKPMHIDIPEQNQLDIETYVQDRTGGIDCHWDCEAVRAKVAEKISKDAHGMFRWAFLQIEHLLKYSSPQEVENRLGRLPKDLTAAYDELYAEPGTYDEIYLQRAVKWVMHAHKPLSTKELLTAVQLRSAYENDDLVLSTRDLRISERALESICRHLIVKDNQGKWFFPHASVQEYFVEKHTALTSGNARIEVAKLSLLVLIESYQGFATTESPDSGRVSHETVRDDGSIVWEPGPVGSLEYYVSRHWVSHIRGIQGVPNGNQQISALLRRFMISPDSPDHSTTEYQRWSKYVMSQPNESDFNGSDFTARDLMPAKNPAFGMAVLGITPDGKDWAKRCLELSLEELQQGGLDTLSLAAKHGRAELCVSLIALGSNPKRILPHHTGALNEAIRNNQKTAVNALLEHGADPNANTGCRALCRAAYWSGPGMVELLLRHGARPDEICSMCSFQCALEVATHGNDRDIAEMLINAGATVDMRLKSKYKTPLMLAAYRGSLDVAKLLIERGADINIKLNIETGDNRQFGGVLGAAFCGLGITKLIPYLVEDAGADANRIIEDLRKRDPWVANPNRDDAIEIGKWLFSKNYLSPEEILRLEEDEAFSSRHALKPLIYAARRYLEGDTR